MIQKKQKNIRVIDLFCGIGGITRGFVDEGFRVVAGIDFLKGCKFWYEANNGGAEFIHKDIRDVTPEELNKHYGEDCDMKILVGCAPCQPFSGMNTKKSDYYYDSQKANLRSPLDKFAELVESIKPDIVSMENVANLIDQKKYPAFSHFLETLKRNGYEVSYQIVDASAYGIPQKRRRLVLLASKLWKIELIPPTHEKPITVRETIGKLPKLGIGETHFSDPYHRTQQMSDLNKERIRYIPKNGGNLSQAPERLVPECHRKKSGKSYSHSVYARMRWDEPAPTLTTLCLGIGNGRYGHPEQDRAISLREAALIQTFPTDYKFIENENEYSIGEVAKYIGNAVPVKLWQVIARSIKNHISDNSKVIS